MSHSRFIPILILCAAGYLSAAEWKPVTPAELAMKTPVIEKDADAEAIFWEVRILDELKGVDLQATRSNYLRLKVFQEKGRERAKVELEYSGKLRITAVAGRTVKPDGTIIEMKHDAIFDRDAVKGKSLRVKAVSFTLPDVQPGDIIEYQWKEVEEGAVSNYVRLPLQRDIPLQAVRYFVKPLQTSYVDVAMTSMTFHAPQKSFTKAPQGYSMLEFTNMPAWKQEREAPPENETRAWALVFYIEGSSRTPEKYWPEQGRKLYNAFHQETKVTGEMKKLVAEVTTGATSDDAKLKAIYAWVRKNIKNVNSITATAEDRAGFKENKSSTDTFKKQLGTGYDVNILFASLAAAAGFEARMALTGDRGRLFFNEAMADRYFLSGEAVAVKVGSTTSSPTWRFYDPATSYLAAGSLVWQQDGTRALITDPKTPQWVTVPLASVAASREIHKVQLDLDKEGGFTGTFEMTYTGHAAENERVGLIGKNAEERVQEIVDQMKGQFASPEVTDVKWEAVDDPELPLTVSFKMKVPAYVQRTGKRIFFQPAVLQFGQAARFTASERKHPVYFHYPWSEMDFITVNIPEGFEFENADIPKPFVSGNLCSWKATARINEGKQLVYQREFQFGADGLILVPAESYSALKTIFTKLHENDEHTFALKQVAK